MVELYDYQKEYLNNLPRDIVMAADVGLGKTIMALEHARRHDVKKIVVVAPASKVRTGDWQREIEQFFEPIAINTNKRVPDYAVLSFEMFAKKWQSLVDNDTTLIIDESHMACNVTTKRGKAVLMASRLAHQWIMLSATPLPNGWRSAETYAVLTGLSRNKTEFVRRFQRIDRSRGFPLLLGYNETDVLEKWWNSIAKPLERTGDLVLPSRNIGIKPPMPAKLARTYKKALKERIIEVDGEIDYLDNPSKHFTALRQVPNPARIDALESIIESTTEHIVVFYNFNSERDEILALLNKSFKTRKVYEQSGHKSDLPSRDKWARLKPSVTLVQYQSGSQAIELTYASVTVYLSPPTSFANYEQSKGRTRRNGQEKQTLFYHIAVPDTLDEHIWGIIKKKRDFSLTLFNSIVE